MKLAFTPIKKYKTNISVDEMKQMIKLSYEAGDILKYREFSSQSYTKCMIQSSRSIWINDPNIKYVGTSQSLHFKLKSPFWNYWNSVSIFIFNEKEGSTIQIEYKYFNLIILPLITLNIIGLAFIIIEWKIALTILTITLPLLILFLTKYKSTTTYFIDKLVY